MDLLAGFKPMQTASTEMVSRKALDKSLKCPPSVEQRLGSWYGSDLVTKSGRSAVSMQGLMVFRASVNVYSLGRRTIHELVFVLTLPNLVMSL